MLDKTSTAALSLNDAICTAQYADRFPTFAEYEEGSPAERRAIMSRWQEIFNRQHNNWIEFGEGAQALGRWCRALRESRAAVSRVEDEATADYREEAEQQSVSINELLGRE